MLATVEIQEGFQANKLSQEWRTYLLVLSETGSPGHLAWIDRGQSL
jgi:hypothetical protein